MEKKQIKKERKYYKSGKYAKAYIVFRSAKATLRLVANIAYVFMFLCVFIVLFLGTTMLPEVEVLRSIADWSPVAEQIIYSPRPILLAVVATQYLCSDDFDWKEYILTIVLVMIVCFGPDRNRIENLRNYILLILGSRKLSFPRLLQIYIPVLFGLLFLTVCGAYQGWADNLIYTAREGRNSYGFVYPTDCAAHFLFASLCYWVLRRDKLYYIEAVVFFLLGILSWYGCKARFSTVLFVLLGITACVYRFLSKKMGEERRNQLFSGSVSGMLVLMPLLCNLGIHILSMIYTTEQKWMVWFNSVVTSRLSFVKRGIDVFGFRLWGSNIPMKGNGGDTLKRRKYYYIDSAFMKVSLLYGILLLMVVLLLITLACMKARQNKDWVLLIALGFVALHGLFEDHSFELAYSPLLLPAFAELGQEVRGKRKIWNWKYKNSGEENENIT